ncbi:HNH endonuclease [Pantoea sp. ANP04]|uniref:HNH endonuclease n=1 Tax=Pantoea sp. ANP04 TaxID=3064896 RepID=UPI0035C6626D
MDHVRPGDDHSLDNLRAICRSCHGRKTAAEGNAARKRLPPKRRPPERHPGLL